jgi:hypothetical protein
MLRRKPVIQQGGLPRGDTDQVLEAVLLMSGRQELIVAKKLADSKQMLIKMLKLIGDLQSTGQPD